MTSDGAPKASEVLAIEGGAGIIRPRDARHSIENEMQAIVARAGRAAMAVQGAVMSITDGFDVVPIMAVSNLSTLSS